MNEDVTLEMVELANDLSEDYVNYAHAINRARSMVRGGWSKKEGGTA